MSRFEINAVIQDPLLYFSPTGLPAIRQCPTQSSHCGTMKILSILTFPAHLFPDCRTGGGNAPECLPTIGNPVLHPILCIVVILFEHAPCLSSWAYCFFHRRYVGLRTSCHFEAPTRGSTNLSARSVSKLPTITTNAEKNKIPNIVGVSLAIID